MYPLICKRLQIPNEMIQETWGICQVFSASFPILYLLTSTVVIDAGECLRASICSKYAGYTASACSITRVDANKIPFLLLAYIGSGAISPFWVDTNSTRCLRFCQKVGTIEASVPTRNLDGRCFIFDRMNLCQWYTSSMMRKEQGRSPGL